MERDTMPFSVVPSTSRLIHSGGINWSWFQIEDGKDAVTFRLHKGEDDIDKLLEDFKDRTEWYGAVKPIRWERFFKGNLNGKFDWIYNRYNLCRDCVTIAVVTGQPIPKGKKLEAFLKKVKGTK